MPYQQGGNISFGGAPFTGQEEEQDPFQLSPYLAGAPPQQGMPGISNYFQGADAPLVGRPPEEQMQQGDEMSPPPQDPLMGELDKAKDWKSGAALGLGAALGGIFGGSGAASAAGASAATTQNHMLDAIQQSRALQAKDRENRFRLSEEKIQGAEKMMSELHGVDMAGMPDHVKQEMTRLTQLYNQKLQGGLTEKEATEVLAMGARMQQLMQEAKADPAYGLGKAQAAGEQARAGNAAALGIDPKDPRFYGQDPKTWGQDRRAEVMAQAKIAASKRAQANGLDPKIWASSWAQAGSFVKQDIAQKVAYGELDVAPSAEETAEMIEAMATEIYKRNSGAGQAAGALPPKAGGSAQVGAGSGLPGVPADDSASPNARKGKGPTLSQDEQRTSTGAAYRLF